MGFCKVCQLLYRLLRERCVRETPRVQLKIKATYINADFLHLYMPTSICISILYGVGMHDLKPQHVRKSYPENLNRKPTQWICWLVLLRLKV